MRVQRDNPVGVRGPRLRPGQPTARKAQSPSGRRMTQDANAGGRKATGTRDDMAGPSASRPAQLAGYGLVPDPERGQTWVR
jgi:hypothetical protein